ncbi:16S rRNA (guanine(966)-N(2))-methyltransferase RsmD [Candidatus Hartigia pinicola]
MCYGKKKQNTSFGQIRIISGKWRGRKLPVRNSDGLRPTTNRVKETLFNWLLPILYESSCLDCFAGSGALGFEALSRSANNVTFIEVNTQNSELLFKNKARLQAHKASIINNDSLVELSKIGTCFDVVFIDPPFRKGLINKTIHLLEKNQWLSNESWIYIESEAELSRIDIPFNWKLHRENITKHIACRLFIRYLILK